MTKRRWVVCVWLVGLVTASAVACSRDQGPQATPTRPPALTLLPADTPTPHIPTRVLATAVAAAPRIPTPTAPLSGPALTDVRFALEVDEAGGLVFPATEFVQGVTRVYVRFSYQELGDVAQVESKWYLNENRISSGKMAWDGDAEGDYVIWIEDPDGLGRGQWRWEMIADSNVLGGGTFAIGGGPGYSNEAWGVSFDPPPTWELASERDSFVTFSSPDQRQAVALRVAPATGKLSKSAAADLALFRVDHPEAEVVGTEEVTMNGKAALLQQIRYVDQGATESGSEDQESGGEESSEQLLFVVSAIHADSAYSLWVLGPADGAGELKRLLAASLLSVRFMAGE